MLEFETLNQALEQYRGSEHGVTYIRGEKDESTVSFRELYERALGVLHHFHDRGVRRGDELILFTQNNEQFIDGFWACLLGGIVPVPIAVGITDEHRFKLIHVFSTLRSPHLYTEISLRKRLRQFVKTHSLGKKAAEMVKEPIVVEEIKNVSTQAAAVEVSSSDTAFIQFSSGSTSAPKGVVLTHDNVVTNIRAIAGAARYREGDVGLSWMPLTHDMGMIGFHLGLLAVNMPHFIMDTGVFVRRPLLWLEKLSEHRATVTCSPNFGYRHALKLLEAKGLDEIDLSHVRVIFNGAEPISVPLCREFMNALAPYGLTPDAMWPVYGLAEASVAVSIPPAGSIERVIRLDRHALSTGAPVVVREDPGPDTLEFICVGGAVRDCEVRITGADGRPLPERHIGHIEIRGGNVTSGYYQAPELTREAMRADGWLDTGDLGFLDDGGLFVTGREKDIIFAHGVNYYPHDLEIVLQEIEGLEMGKVVVTSARRGAGETDEILVFVQHRGDTSDFAPLAAAIRHHMNERTGLEVGKVIPLARVPKTTSGKIQRAALAEAYAGGDYDGVITALDALLAAEISHGGDAANAIEQQLLKICNEIVTDWAIGPDDNLFDIGISSLSLVLIHERIDELYPGKLDVTDIFETPTVREIANVLAERIDAEA